MDFPFEYRRYELDFRHSVRTSRGMWTRRQGIYLRVERPDRTVGFSEVAPVPGFGSDSLEESEEVCRLMGGRVTASSLAAVPRNLGALRFALSSAIGSHPPEPVHRSLGVAALLPAGRSALAEAPAKAEAGFRVFKWKVGVAAADDERSMLDDLLGLLPQGSRVRLDANGAWNRATAEGWLAHAAECPVEFVEQPVAAGEARSRDLLLGLAADYPVPIALDESLVDEGDVGRWLDDGWKGYFVIKPSLMGDLEATLGRLASAQARVIFSSALETAMGARDALRHAFAWKGAASALGFGVWPIFADPRFDGPSALPFLHLDDVDRIDPVALWNARP